MNSQESAQAADCVRKRYVGLIRDMIEGGKYL